MTSVFGADGKNIPCTVIEAGPCVVTQLRTLEKDGYEAVQLAYDEIKEIHASEPLKGHFKKAGTTPKRKLVEFPADFEGELKLGDTITVGDIMNDVKFVWMLSVLPKERASRVLFTVITSPVSAEPPTVSTTAFASLVHWELPHGLPASSPE